MVWYIAITAVLNLAFGYALAVFMGASRPQTATAAGESLAESSYSDADLES
jgi:hypothetical protein